MTNEKFTFSFTQKNVLTNQLFETAIHFDLVYIIIYHEQRTTMDCMQSLYSAASDGLSSSSIDSNQSMLRLQIREQRRKTKLLICRSVESHETISSDINKELDRLNILESRQRGLLLKEDSLQQPTIRDPSTQGAGGRRLREIRTQNQASSVNPFPLDSNDKRNNVFFLSAFLWGFISFDQSSSLANFQQNDVRSDDEASLLSSDAVYQHCRRSAGTEGNKDLLTAPFEIIIPVREDKSYREKLTEDFERSHRQKEATHKACCHEQSLSFASFARNRVPYATHPFHSP